MSNGKLADAVRVLLYGNGDLQRNIDDVAEALAEVDSVPAGPYITNRLKRLARRANESTYDLLSGDKWNEEPKAYSAVESKG